METAQTERTRFFFGLAGWSFPWRRDAGPPLAAEEREEKSVDGFHCITGGNAHSSFAEMVTAARGLFL